MNAQPASTAATADTRLRVQDGQEVSLHAEFQYTAASNTLLVRYRLRNAGDHALAVFDRGSYGDRAGAVYNPGPIGKPRVEQHSDGIVLLHAPAPASAASPMDPLGNAGLALEVKAGAEHADQFVHRFDGAQAPQRVRWCVAVAPLDKKQFRMPTQTGQGTVWVAGEAGVEAQQVCTPWFDVGAGKFVE